MRRILLSLVLLCLGSAFVLADYQPGKWEKLGASGGSLGGATVYVPTRGQVLRWGGLKSGNEVRALEVEKLQWVADYQPDKEVKLGGNFYGGQPYQTWVKRSNRPGPFFLFRQACWDSSRLRLVFVMENFTAAYHPTTKSWTDLDAVFDNGKQEVKGTKDVGYAKPWTAPVPGQWGSCAYDEVNDEVVLFPLWVTRTRPYWMLPQFQVGPDRPDDAGVRAGHYGTFIFDCKTNTWRIPRLGSKVMLSLRGSLVSLIDQQREATRLGWKALMAQRQGNRNQAANLMGRVAAAQAKVNENLQQETGRLEELAGELSGYEKKQLRQAQSSFGQIMSRARKAQFLLEGYVPEKLPAICSQQRVIYHLLRLARDEDLYVQPTPRCATSVVYDSRNKCIVMAGGNHFDRLLGDTWVYDCVSRRWQRKLPAPEAANWPGMCYDSKRGRVVYSTENHTYTYDATSDRWMKVGAGRPKGKYCDTAYDVLRDLYVLNVSDNKYKLDETTYVMKPADEGSVVAGVPAPRVKVDDAPFPPPADAVWLRRLKNMPVNTWVRAHPNFEPTHRSWSTMSWDPVMRGVIYQGGGHAGTMNNTVSAYFPEANKWVDAFQGQYAPPIFHAWQSAGDKPAYERGMGLASHCRWYESYAGRIVYGSTHGFEWATREQPIRAESQILAGKLKISGVMLSGGKRCLDPARGLLVGTESGRSSSSPVVATTVYVTDLVSGEEKAYRLDKPMPALNCEWSAICVHPDKNVLVLHGMGDHKKATDTETWLLDLDDPVRWEKVELTSTTPSVGMAKLSPIPGTDYLVCAMPASNDLWVFSFAHQAWKPLGVKDGDDKLKPDQHRFDLYGQCVWDPHHQVFIMVGLRGSYSQRYTFLLKPDFSKIKW